MKIPKNTLGKKRSKLSVIVGISKELAGKLSIHFRGQAFEGGENTAGKDCSTRVCSLVWEKKGAPQK